MNGFHWDYEVFLFIALIVTLSAWVVSKVKKRRTSENSFIRFTVAAGGFFPVFFLILSVRSFAFEPFRIPSSSMMPTLLTGDFIYVDKSAYGLKMPVFNNTLIETGHPEKGDVFVFRSVEDPSIDVIKRVIGVPGDHIRYDQRSKQLYVNNQLVNEHFNGAYTGFHDDINPNGLKQKTSKTGLKRHTVLYSNGVHRNYQHTDLVVPEGYYFGMGDNRDFSKDSRIFGLIPEENIVGQAKFIWMHWRPNAFIEGLKRVGNLL
jgi:signal peptidase I